MRVLAALLIAALALVSCSRRERANPFDPANPDTRGRPAGFVAQAGNGLVVLRWRNPGAIDLAGYRVQRRLAGQTDYATLVELLPATATSFGDFGLLNGVRHEYRLAYVFAEGVAPVAAEDFATPGPLRPWITDVGAGELLELTADGRHVLAVDRGFVSPAHLAVDGATGDVWVGDSYTGDVTVLNTSGQRRVITSLLRPAGLAIDPLDHSLWVCDEHFDEVAHFLPSGEAAAPPRIGPLELPLDVAVDPVANLVWVCENGDPSLRAFRRNGVAVFDVAVPRPSRVAVDSLTHDAWTTSFERGLAVRVNSAGFPTDTVTGLRGPIGVAVDSRRGAIWIADALANQVVVVDRGARIVRRIGGLAQAREIALDLATGNAWVVTPGDGRVVVLSPEGVEIDSQAGFESPYDIALDPGIVVRGPGRTQGAMTSLRAPARPASTSRTR